MVPYTQYIDIATLIADTARIFISNSHMYVVCGHTNGKQKQFKENDCVARELIEKLQIASIVCYFFRANGTILIL